MNKSKFLKKSLAMLLALMLVVAMIPLSASAAGEAPAVAKVWIDGKVATLSGTTYSAEIVEPGRTEQVEVKVQLEGDDGTFGVAYYNELGDDNKAELTEKGVYTFNLAAGVTSGEFYTTNNQGAKSEPYTVTFTTVDASDDAGVLSVSLPGMYDWYADDITDFVIVPHYGWDFSKKVPVSVELSNENATVSTGDVIVDKYYEPVSFTVKAESGKTENYTVMLVEPVPFSSFAVEDERHESQISRVTEEPMWQVEAEKEPRVEVYLPYGYEGTKFTPVFETNYDIKVWANGVQLISGETYDWTKLGTNKATSADDILLDITVEYSDLKTENWELAIDKIQKDVEANINGLIVQNYVAEIEDDVITLTLPASVRDTATSLQYVTSAGSVVKIVNTTIGDTAGSDEGGNLNFAAKFLADEDEYTLRVTAAAAEFDAEGVKAVKDYTLVIEDAVEESPKLNSMKLKNEDTGEEISATIEKDAVVFNNIPYRIKSIADLAEEGWQLFWSASSGTTITSKNQPIAITGSTVADWDYLPDANRATGQRFVNATTTQDNQIVVANTRESQRYFVKFNSAKASQDSTLTELDLAVNGTLKYSDVDELNTTELKIDNGTDKITANIYFNEWDKYTDGGTKSETNYKRGGTLVGTLPYESEIYFYLPSTKLLGQIDALNEINEEVTAEEVLPVAHTRDGDTRYANAVDYGTADPANEWAEKYTGKEPLKIIVVSEAGAEQIQNGSDYATAEKLIKDGLATEYELTLTQMKPRDDTNLDKVSIYDAYTGDRVYGEIKGDEITFELPYYFIDGNRKDHNQLYFDYEPQRGGVTVTSTRNNLSDVLNPLTWNTDGEVSSTATKVAWLDRMNGGKHEQGIVLYDDATGSQFWFETLTSDPENPKASEQTFKVNFIILEPEEDAELNSVTIAGSTGTPNSKNEVTVNVPKSTEITSQTAIFNVSKNAYVVVGDAKNIQEDGKFQVSPTDTFNFLKTRTFTVVSEDGNDTRTYTINVVPSETFVDVDPDDWFYDEVMTAADKGWVAGEGNGVFNPNGTLKRGDFALMIARILGYDEASYSKTAFPDVASDKYYSAAVAFCKENNIIDGDDKGNFNGEDAITREQMAKILCQALQLKVTIPEKTYDDDAKIAGWAKDYVYACQEAGVMEGDNGSFRPKDNATRAEAATVLVRAFA